MHKANTQCYYTILIHNTNPRCKYKIQHNANSQYKNTMPIHNTHHTIQRKQFTHPPLHPKETHCKYTIIKTQCYYTLQLHSTNTRYKNSTNTQCKYTVLMHKTNTQYKSTRQIHNTKRMQTHNANTQYKNTMPIHNAKTQYTSH